MSLVPLLPIFHRLNREYFDSSLTSGPNPILSVRWSDGRLRKTAGFYRKRSSFLGFSSSEIVLSAPILEKLPSHALESTLCHEMIHAWIDLVLGVKESHGINFHRRMNEINSSQERFLITISHTFPVPITSPKWLALCPKCGLSSFYKRRMSRIACKSCCDLHYGGNWNENCLLTFQPFLKEA
tara:strand:+ start:245 stop:793 length:549 start_codon:yes stop_codon:yes gene_type:complete